MRCHQRRLKPSLDAGDIAIRIGHISDTAMTQRKLCEDDAIPCASPAYLAAHGRPQHPAQLARQAKQSGNGREWGEEGLNEFVEVKAIQV